MHKMKQKIGRGKKSVYILNGRSVSMVIFSQDKSKEEIARVEQTKSMFDCHWRNRLKIKNSVSQLKDNEIH